MDNNNISKLEKLTKFLNSDVKDIGDSIAEKAAEEEYTKNCIDVLSFDRCLLVAQKFKAKYSQINKFIITVELNKKSRNENDKLCITQAFIDSNNRIITFDGKTALSKNYFCRTIDSKFINFLDGDSKKIFVMK